MRVGLAEGAEGEGVGHERFALRVVELAGDEDGVAPRADRGDEVGPGLILPGGLRGPRDEVDPALGERRALDLELGDEDVLGRKRPALDHRKVRAQLVGGDEVADAPAARDEFGDQRAAVLRHERHREHRPERMVVPGGRVDKPRNVEKTGELRRPEDGTAAPQKPFVRPLEEIEDFVDPVHDALLNVPSKAAKYTLDWLLETSEICHGFTAVDVVSSHNSCANKALRQPFDSGHFAP